MDEITTVFVTESREQLLAFESALLALESAPDDDDVLNAAFRAAHTIKGGAGVVECDYIVSFTHVVENVLDQLRNRALTLDSDLVALLLGCGDHLGVLLDALASGSEPDAETLAESQALSQRLSREWLERDATTRDTLPAAAAPHADDSDLCSREDARVETDCWHISLRFGEPVLRNGMDPLSFLRFLQGIGRIVHLETLLDTMPAADQMDPESCYLGFEISFASDADKAQIEQVFDFVRDECELYILPPHSRLSDYLHLIDELPEDNLRLGEILIRIGALTEHELTTGLTEQASASATTETAHDEAASTTETRPIGEILVDNHAVQPELVAAAVSRQKHVEASRLAESRLIRIPADKLDRLIDLVGELVIAGASVNLLAERSKNGELVEATSLTSRLVEGIRDAALQLRMVQIGETFNRFNRVVRDTARELKKEIDLVITGGDTELDKSMVEKIGDPLMHLVRNAMDHGIESPEERVVNGKPARGRLELNAYHDSGSIIIEVVDDGRGIDREAVIAKAVERGLIASGQNMTDTEVFNLLFEAGFSTAKQVSELSGRGVGMDVVRRNIQSLRGTVDVQSELGQGSRFAIRLPLTLAIIDGFLVGVERATYVIPLDTVVECIELGHAKIEKGKGNQRDYVNLRGEVLPLARLRDMFDAEDDEPQRQNVVVVQYGGQKAGIVVDQLMGEFQTVIKPLGPIFRYLRGIAGSTILGSGEVALILDVSALVQRCADRDAQGRERLAAVR